MLGGGQPGGGAMGVVVVLRQQELLSRTGHDAVVENAQPDARARRHRDVLSPASQIGRERLAYPGPTSWTIGQRQPRGHRERIGIDLCTQMIHRIPHHLRMRGQVEQRKVHPSGLQAKLRPQGVPVHAPVDRDDRPLPRCSHPCRAGAGHEGDRHRSRRSCQQTAPTRHRHPAPLCTATGGAVAE